MISSKRAQQTTVRCARSILRRCFILRVDGWSTKKERELSGVPPESAVRKKAQDLISKAAAEEQQYDRTVTPASIAGLGEAASVARLRGALADLSYNQNRLRRLEDKSPASTGGRRFSPSLGTLGRWQDQPQQSERYATAHGAEDSAAAK